MNELTAQALHALYEPLWAKVPETRPKGLAYDRTEWGIGWLYPGLPTILPVVSAAALCRVAAEDWFSQRVGAKDGFLIHGTTVKWDLQYEYEGDWWNETREGPTIHHALVAACLAVAEAEPPMDERLGQDALGGSYDPEEEP